MANAPDISGRKFYRLAVVKRGWNAPKRTAQFWCICDCGIGVLVRAVCLRKGHTKSCGCYKRELTSHNNVEVFSTHGHSIGGKTSPEYRAWSEMKRRCSSLKLKYWKNYGSRGIKVCERWINSFETFFADMGEKPSSKHSIDRYPNNDGNYEPGNCRWATAKQQANNRRSRC